MRPEECIGGIGCDHPLGASVRLLTTLCGDPVLLAGDCDENALSTSGDLDYRLSPMRSGTRLVSICPLKISNGPIASSEGIFRRNHIIASGKIMECMKGGL